MSAAPEPALGARTRRLRPWILTGVAVFGLALVLTTLALVVEPVRQAAPPLRLAGDSIDVFLAAIRALGRRLAAVELPALAGALALSSLNIVLRSAAWRHIIVAAYPGQVLRWRHAFGAAYAGIGANAVLPARIGDALKLVLVHRRLAESTYPTLASTLVAETIFDAVVGACLLVWAWQAGLLPLAPALPRLPLFELRWYADHPWILAAIGGFVLLVLLLAQRHVRAFWSRVGQGLTILTQPLRYARQVVVYQALGWGCRVAAAYLFLEAFAVAATVRNALLVQVASSLSTLVPATPGGLGPRQALYVVLLSGAGSREALLAFGVGTGLALAIWNAVVGFIALALALRGAGMRDALRAARRRAKRQ